MARFIVLLVVLGVIGAGIFAWTQAAWDQSGPSQRETIVLIPPGTRAHDVAQMLEDKGAVSNVWLFEFGLRSRKLADKIKAGEYALPAGASMGAVAAILVEGKSIQHKLTAAEGLTSDMIWKMVQNDSALEGDAGPVPEEGTLLPETYLFTRGQSRAGLLDQMRRAQERFLAARWSARAEGLPFSSMREAVILASIVEKETALPEERPHIASVFVNRLKVGMRLQSDPTIIYGLTRGYPLGRGIRQSEIAGATPYNTYVIAGLPPAPIANPGKDAIAAVLNPQVSEDLFFVANGKGGHVFAPSMSEHARNVVAFRNIERAARREVQASEALNDTANVSLPDTALPILPQTKIKPRPAPRRRARP
jgi:UPF0755 protein